MVLFLPSWIVPNAVDRYKQVRVCGRYIEIAFGCCPKMKKFCFVQKHYFYLLQHSRFFSYQERLDRWKMWKSVNFYMKCVREKLHVIKKIKNAPSREPLRVYIAQMLLQLKVKDTILHVHGAYSIKCTNYLDFDIRLEPVSKPVLNNWLERNMKAKWV